MLEGFDREFYRPRWQQILPLGPHGIRPYVRSGRDPRPARAGAILRLLGAMLAAMTPGVIALWRPGATDMVAREGRRWPLVR